MIRTVKGLADINLNMELDYIIEDEINANAAKTIEKDYNDMIWEVDSCPDMYHGKEKVSPGEPDPMNMSWPGLNQDCDPLDK